MRIQLNLATRPFVELGPLYMRLRILIILLAVIAVPLWILLATENRKASEGPADRGGTKDPGDRVSAAGLPGADAAA
jgi:hypothetical protein